MGSTAISNGEAPAMTGAILGHANPRSTAIYAHVQTDPSRRAANRVTKKTAVALAGKPASDRPRKRGTGSCRVPGDDSDLLRLLAERLAETGRKPVAVARRSARWSAEIRPRIGRLETVMVFVGAPACLFCLDGL
jgi:hypothetical protein